MKLLFDENLSFRLTFLLSDAYPLSAHCDGLGLMGHPDSTVWQFAIDHEFMIVSKDTDFYDRSILLGSPPKIIWLRTGNCSVQETAKVLRNNYIKIHLFAADQHASFLILPSGP